jgi:hypothetical protein
MPFINTAWRRGAVECYPSVTASRKALRNLTCWKGGLSDLHFRVELVVEQINEINYVSHIKGSLWAGGGWTWIGRMQLRRHRRSELC